MGVPDPDVFGLQVKAERAAYLAAAGQGNLSDRPHGQPAQCRVAEGGRTQAQPAVKKSACSHRLAQRGGLIRETGARQVPIHLLEQADVRVRVRERGGDLGQ